MKIEGRHYRPFVNKFFYLNFLLYDQNKHSSIVNLIADWIVANPDDDCNYFDSVESHPFFVSLNSRSREHIIQLVTREHERLASSTASEMMKHLFLHELMWHTRDFPIIHMVPFMDRYVGDIMTAIDTNRPSWLKFFLTRTVCFELLNRYVNHDRSVLINVSRRITSDIEFLLSEFGIPVPDKFMAPAKDFLEWLDKDIEHCYSMRNNSVYPNMINSSIYNHRIDAQSHKTVTYLEASVNNDEERRNQFNSMFNLYLLGISMITSSDIKVETY